MDGSRDCFQENQLCKMQYVLEVIVYIYHMMFILTNKIITQMHRRIWGVAKGGNVTPDVSLATPGSWHPKPENSSLNFM